jgi:N-acylneuraminate cytidylyltransferase/CMP-N,N'-diacetyllegionaminic acid synthase
MTPFLAIIPARGGSKGLPRKNIRPLLDKPLIAYTIMTALRAKALGRLVVSTDDPEIATIAKSYGAEVPFLRPAELGQDDTPTIEVVRHVLANLKPLKSEQPEIVVLLQPTSPLRRAKDIDEAVAKLESSRADSVVSVCAVDHGLQWMMQLHGDRVLPLVGDAQKYVRRQDLPIVYQMNGAVYVTRTDVIIKQHRLFGEDTRGYIMDAESSIDIDTALDMKIASLLMKERLNERMD